MARGKITPQQARFVEEYVLDLNATAAAERAGYSKKSAAYLGYQLLQKPPVQAALQAALQARSHRTGITADRVLAEVFRLATSDFRQALDENGNLRPVHEIPEDVARAIGGIEVEQLFEGRGENREHVGTLRKVKFWDKNRAAEMLMKHLGLFGGNGGGEDAHGLADRLDRFLAREEAKA